ncbi:MAG: Alcohol dehydrogenase zinc-binding domain protein [Frankiales bacterium]|nr:Alcohol dehydrogenase zinc-binding domain protein [Frankiales bacterium]
MRAVVIEPREGGARLVVKDVEEPAPGPRDVMVRVCSAGLNRADLRRAASHFARSEGAVGPAIGGLELAGEVVARGADVHDLVVGDRVMAMSGGAWAELAAFDHRLSVRVPADFTWHQAAATPISFITAHDALSRAAGFRQGETVLIQGATSSAGLAATQLAVAMGAKKVFATSTSPRKLPTLTALGAVSIDATSEDVARRVQEETDGLGADVVLDIVGEGVVQQNIDAAAVQGRIVCLGRLAGTVGQFNLDEFSRKRIVMTGVTFRTRTSEERFQVVRRFTNEILPLLRAGSVVPMIDRSFALPEVELAEDYMKTSAGIGKILIDVA